MAKKIKLWVLLSIVTTAAAGMIYISVQQVLRLGANDPQIQMAEDIAAELSSGQKPETVVPTTKVDIAASLAPFVIIFDSSGKPLSSSATLDGQTPLLPDGVLASVAKNGEDRLTWQPKDKVRNAAVITKFNGTTSGYVLVGRSLVEVEKREALLLFQVGVIWLLTLGAVAAVLLAYPNKKSADKA